MTYLQWLSEMFRNGGDFSEANARWRQERLAANNGQERARVSLPHYLAALWNGQSAATNGDPAPKGPSQSGNASQARSQVSSPNKFTHPELGQPPKPPVPPEFALDEAQNNILRVREIAGILTNELRDVTPGESTAAELERAKRAKADAIINADMKYGVQRKKLARTTEPTVSFELSKSPQYQQNLRIAREQVLGRKLGTAQDTADGRAFIGNSSTILHSRPIGHSRQTVYQQFGPFKVGQRSVYDYTFNDPLPEKKKKRDRQKK